MAEYHPATIHFPIVLLCLWPVLDATGLWFGREDVCRSALVLLSLALLACLISTVTGQAAFDAAVERGFDTALLETHSANADLVPWLVLVVLLIRSVGVHKFGRKAQVLALALGFGLSGFLFSVADRGGDLVFDNGVGVRLSTEAKAK